MNNATVKTGNRPQICGKNGSLQPGWVNIQVPAEIAKSLEEIIDKRIYLPVLAMVVSRDVFDRLKDLLDDPPDAKNTLLETLFSFLDMDTFTNNSNYDQNIHVLFKNMYNTLFECTEFLEMQKMKGGAHV